MWVEMQVNLNGYVRLCTCSVVRGELRERGEGMFVGAPRIVVWGWKLFNSLDGYCGRCRVMENRLFKASIIASSRVGWGRDGTKETRLQRNLRKFL